MVHSFRENSQNVENAIFRDFLLRGLRGSNVEIGRWRPYRYLRAALTKMVKNGQNRKIAIFLETMDPGGDFGMVIARIGRVVIFWQISKVGSPLRGVLGSKGVP